MVSCLRRSDYKCMCINPSPVCWPRRTQRVLSTSQCWICPERCPSCSQSTMTCLGCCRHVVLGSRLHSRQIRVRGQCCFSTLTTWPLPDMLRECWWEVSCTYVWREIYEKLRYTINWFTIIDYKYFCVFFMGGVTYCGGGCTVSLVQGSSQLIACDCRPNWEE